MDYASVVGGCIGVSTPAGARMAGLAPTGTMAHALILIFGDTVRAVEAFDRHVEPDVPASRWSTPSRMRRRNRSGWPTRWGSGYGACGWTRLRSEVA